MIWRTTKWQSTVTNSKKKQFRLSLSKGKVALVLNRAGKLKKIRDFTHKRLVEAHENQRLTWLDVCPITRRLMQMRQWKEELDQGLDLKCLAQREGVEPKRIAQLLCLLKLPNSKKELILNNDPSIREMSIRQAIKEANAYQSWLDLTETLGKVKSWHTLIAKGHSQSMIAAEEGLTRARVCQLMKLTSLDHEIKKGIMRGDREYMGISIRSLIKVSEKGLNHHQIERYV
jgi:hypothetical protein